MALPPLRIGSAITASGMLRAMQRLFSSFPAGLPGLGAFILRMLVALGPWPSVVPASNDLSTAICLALMGILSGMLLLGCFTPVVVAAQIAVIGGAVLAGWASIGGGVTVLHLMGAAALLLLGPGAYSVDARRYGRRVVHIQGRPRP